MIPNLAPPRLRVLLLACCLLLGAGPWLAPAAAGTYSVPIGSTAAFPGWWSPWVGTSHYRVGDMYVDTAAGSYVVGSYRRLRLEAPADLRFQGGRIDGRLYTPNEAFVGQVRQGEADGAARAVLASKENGAFTAALGAGTWLEVGLLADRSTSAADNGGNRVTITSLSVTMADAIDPEVAPTRLPDPAAWYGPACVQAAWVESDRGSGVTRSELRNATTGVTLAAWSQPDRAGLAPGTPSVGRSTCITGAAQRHGVNHFTATAVDRAGRARAHAFQVRFDLDAPRYGALPADGTTRDEQRPTFTVPVTDAESGMQELVARVDGQSASVQTVPGGYRVAPDRALGVGAHELHLIARDAVGNSREVRRTFTVTDASAPVLEWVAPGASGGPAPALHVVAEDENGIDSRSWRLLVNDQPVPATGSDTRVTADLGPLAPGSHRIELRVNDRHGNASVVVRTYTVTGEAGRATALAGGRSGVFVGVAPKGVVRWGAQIRIVATAAQHGRPLTGHRVTLRQGGATLASDVADVSGTVDLRAVVRRPGSLELTADGTSIPIGSVPLRVAPSITLVTDTRKPRVGQTVRVTGTVRPGLRGRKLALEARVGGSWYPLRRSVAVGAGGRYRTAVTSAAKGDVAIRVRLAGRGGWSTATSNARVLHVR